MDARNIIISPVITEKGSLERKRNRYIFKVLQAATKVDIKNAIREIFNVKVKDVNTIRVRGKVRGAIRGKLGSTSSWKKAYVTLQDGQKIESLES